jgi:hypothetical protein
MLRTLTLLLALLPLAVHAEQIDPRLYKHDVCGFYTIVHINGVDTTEAGAIDNLNALATAYGNAHNGFAPRYHLAYNATLSLKYDVAESMYQTLATLPGTTSTSTFEEWVNAFYNHIFPSDWPIDQMSKISAKLATIFNIRRPDSYYSFELMYILGKMQGAGLINSGAKMLLVGHSQGSIYAPILFRTLTSATYGMKPHQIGLMSIAAFTESPMVGTGSLYVTNGNDRPVQMARTAWPLIMPKTVTIPHTENFYSIWRGHNLINKYLKDTNSKGQIKSKMKTVLDGLKKGAPGGGPTYGNSASVATKVNWFVHPADGQGYMQYQDGPTNGSSPLITVPASKEQARLKAIELEGRCTPWVMSMLQAYWKLGLPSPPGIYAGGCWTSQYSNYQAWSVYSSDGLPRPPAFAVWDTYNPQGWLAYAGYTCQ